MVLNIQKLEHLAQKPLRKVDFTLMSHWEFKILNYFNMILKLRFPQDTESCCSHRSQWSFTSIIYM